MARAFLLITAKIGVGKVFGSGAREWPNPRHAIACDGPPSLSWNGENQAADQAPIGLTTERIMTLNIKHSNQAKQFQVSFRKKYLCTIYPILREPVCQITSCQKATKPRPYTSKESIFLEEPISSIFIRGARVLRALYHEKMTLLIRCIRPYRFM